MAAMATKSHFLPSFQPLAVFSCLHKINYVFQASIVCIQYFASSLELFINIAIAKQLLSRRVQLFIFF